MLNPPQTKPAATNVANQLARQAHRTIRAWQDADAEGEETFAEIHLDRLDTLESEVTWHQAGSPEAVLFQLCVIKNLADDIRDYAAASGHGRTVDPKFAAIERLVGSVIRHVERTTGTAREAWGLDYYHTDAVERFSWGAARDKAA